MRKSEIIECRAACEVRAKELIKLIIGFWRKITRLVTINLIYSTIRNVQYISIQQTSTRMQTRAASTCYFRLRDSIRAHRHIVLHVTLINCTHRHKYCTVLRCTGHVHRQSHWLTHSSSVLICSVLTWSDVLWQPVASSSTETLFCTIMCSHIYFVHYNLMYNKSYELLVT